MRYILLVGALVLLLTSPTLGREPWRIAVVVYGSLDATCGDRPVTSVTTPAMRELALAETAQFTATLNKYTPVEVTVIERPVMSRLEPVADGRWCWPHASPIPPDVDSALILWPAHLANGQYVFIRAGQAYAGPDPTYGTAVIPDGSPHADQDLSRIMIHEWLHGVLAVMGEPDTLDTDVGSELDVLASLFGAPAVAALPETAVPTPEPTLVPVLLPDTAMQP